MGKAYFSFKPYLLAVPVIFLISILVYSCKKDQNTLLVEDKIIAETKTWFNVQTGGLPITAAIFAKNIQSGNTIPTSTNQNLTLDWRNAKSYKDVGRTIVEVPMVTEGIFIFNTEALSKKNDKVEKNKSITRLLISKTLGYTEACFMTIIFGNDYLTHAGVRPENNTYLKQENNFEGIILYHNLQGEYIASKRFGKMRYELDKQLSLSPIKNRNLSIAYPDDCKDIPVYQIMGYNCVDVGSNFTYCQSVYSNYIGSQTICGTGHQTDPWQGNPWGNSGTSNNVNKIIVTDTSILNSVKAKCALLKLLNNNVKFDSLLKAFTGAGFNLTFKVKDVMANDPLSRGETTNNPLNKTEIYINLRRSFVNSAPAIQIAKTLLHEAFHANLMQKAYEVFGTYDINNNWTKKPENMELNELMDIFESKLAGTSRADIHHQYIAQNIGVLVSGLKEFAMKYDSNFSNYNDNHFNGLAWEGLEITKYYKDNVKNLIVDYFGHPETADNAYKNLQPVIISDSQVNCVN